MPTLFAIAILSMLDEETIFEISFENPLTLALIIMALVMIPASILVPKLEIKKLKPEVSLQKKIATFQKAIIIRE